jgi:predicted SAM-dependent methyltransferase
MRSQRLKDVYYIMIRPISMVNGWLWSVRNQFFLGIGQKKIFLNLGCGDKYFDGFINIDGNIFRRKDMWLDLRNSLPFPSQSVDRIYSCHVFEHFYMDELKIILKECQRVLKPGGGMRILVPSLEQAVTAYIAGKKEWFSDFPSSYQSIGGRFFNYIFCDSQHRLTFDYSFFDELLHEAGFQNVITSEPGKSVLFPSEILDKIEHPNEGYIQTSLVVDTISQ